MTSIPATPARTGGARSGATARHEWISVVVATVGSAAIVWLFGTPLLRDRTTTAIAEVGEGALFFLLGIAVAVMIDGLRSARPEAGGARRGLARHTGDARRISDLNGSGRVFQAVIDHAPGIIVAKDPDGMLLLFNNSFARSVGLNAEQIRGRRVYDLFPPDVAARRREADQTVMRTRAPIALEETVKLSDGSHVFLATAFPLEDEAGVLFGVCWMETDITARKRAEENYETSRKLLQAIIDYSPNTIVVKDLDGRIMLLNRRFEQMLGAQEGTLHGRVAYDLFPGSVGERRRETDRTVVATRAPVAIEETIELADGPHVFLATAFPLTSESGAVFAVCWFETDITERTRMETRLRRTALELAEAQRAGRIGSWCWEIAANTVSWSDEMYRLHRIDTRERLAPVPALAALYTHESAAALRAALDQVAADGTAFELELETIQPAGGTRWIRDRGEPVRDRAGAISGVRGISQDITLVKEIERMREEWISVIAHDLRQPIGTITMAAQLLPELHVGELNEAEARITKRVETAAQSLGRMVDDLLDVSRLVTHRLPLDLAWVNPQSLIRESIDALPALDGECKVSLIDEGAPTKVFADAGRLAQILGNLISNAAKYGEPHETIHVRLGGDAKELHLSVLNRGHGISRDDRARLFTRFMRLKDARRSGIQGLGLGLYIVKGLVEAHGGRIWVDSIPNETTTFHLVLPVDGAAHAIAA